MKTGGTVGDVSCNRANDLNTFGGMRKEDGAAADAANCHTIDEVRMATFLKGAHVTGEKAEGMRDGGIPKPSDLGANREPILDWAQLYQRLWKLKLLRLHEDNG